MSRAVTIEDMEARYLTNESGERTGVVLDVAEYERLRRSTEETARTERHPGIAFRGTGAAAARGYRARRSTCGRSSPDTRRWAGRDLEESNIPEDRLDAALAYYEAYPDEIDQKINENNRRPEYWRERYPNLNIQSIEY